MRTFPISFMILVGVVLAVAGCAPVEALPGQAGGPCRASLTPCDPGLSCAGNGCEADTPQSASKVDVAFALKDGKSAVEADGRDTTVLTARFAEVSAGYPDSAPPNLQFRMWVDPPEAGTIEFSATSNPEVQADARSLAWRITDANGAATVRFTGCDKAMPGCVRFAAIRVAIAPNALVPIGMVAVENIGAEPPPERVSPDPDRRPDTEPTRPSVVDSASSSSESEVSDVADFPTRCASPNTAYLHLPNGLVATFAGAVPPPRTYVVYAADSSDALFEGEADETFLSFAVTPFEWTSDSSRFDGPPDVGPRLYASFGGRDLLSGGVVNVRPERREDDHSPRPRGEPRMTLELKRTNGFLGTWLSCSRDGRFMVHEFVAVDGVIDQAIVSFERNCDEDANINTSQLVARGCIHYRRE